MSAAQGPLLQPAEVLPYLLLKGLISSEEALSGDLEVQDVSRRNNNYRVLTESGHCLLLKQAVDSDSLESLTHEAAVYDCLWTSELFAGLRRFVPRHVANPCRVVRGDLKRRRRGLHHIFFSIRTGAELDPAQ